MNKKERVSLAEEFLRALGRGIPDDERVMAGYADEATVQMGADGKKLNGGWWPVPWRDGKWINPNANCYVCISSSRKTENPKTGKLRYWRGEASFGHGLALMVDDVGTGRGSKGGLTVEAMGRVLPPTAVVETSPNNYQLWYFLDEPCSDMRRFKGFITSFVASVLKAGGDHTIKDVSRYGRMPCGVNNKRESGDGPFKYADADGRPYEVGMRWFDASVRYSMEAIARAFSFEILVPAPPRRIEVDANELRADMTWLVMAEKILSRAKLGEGSGGAVAMNMSGKYRIACPWGHEHTNGDPFGAYFRGPIPGADVDFVFGCGHDTCRRENRRTWSSFVDEVVMPLIEGELAEVNAQYAYGNAQPA